MNNLRDKNILIIMPQFYSYQTKMREDLEARGAHPHFYNEEPEKTKFLILKNIGDLFHNEHVFDGFNRKLKKQILAEMPAEGYDYLLVIRGNVLTEQTIHELKNKALKSSGKSVYYAWDSFENMRHKGEIGRLFDWRGTFDSVDAKESELGYELVPLFYSDEFDGGKLEQSTEYKYDYVSVSAFFPFRYRYFKAFKKANPDKKMCLKLYLNPSVYRGKKLKDPKLVKDLDMDIISFEPFKPEEIRDMCKNSKAILDLAHEQQQGLTMRTMETLGIKRKLVTNNIYLRDYEFYNETNDLILTDLAAKADKAEHTGDYSDFVLPGDEWLDKPYLENEDVRQKYSIHSWIDNLFIN
ncbi:hypothetical protein SAMN04487831_103254 [Pseudobutyrivibrio sp. UC1225]|uniref:hypothetical protein n=1 Tax=Pseudobutyrivibrio sp. UC1225 TaxID=1798185 RepID=UPI0008EE8317|nr:hypothetical protein [Pseudobutyrivibrio sp. UC1225]SFN77808.1 hypothetical protein SAMN04487831_103254 [Pseudobutyrivibrio sp. UC1225]